MIADHTPILLANQRMASWRMSIVKVESGHAGRGATMDKRTNARHHDDVFHDELKINRVTANNNVICQQNGMLTLCMAQGPPPLKALKE